MKRPKHKNAMMTLEEDALCMCNTPFPKNRNLIDKSE